MSRPFYASFVAGEPAARDFLALDFRERSARENSARRAANRTIHPAVLAELRVQNAAFPESAARCRHLETLAQPGAAVVITGQQTGLFLGPLYTFYKAATAVAAARALGEESGVPCVPIFWLQTEDHDFEEIAACHDLGADGAPCCQRVAADPEATARTSVAHRRLGPEVNAALAGLEEALGGLPHAAAVLARLRAHYRPGVGLGAAFAGVLAELFAREGLLVFNPRVAAVAKAAAPLYRRAIDDAATIGEHLSTRAQALRAAGLAVQIPTRQNCALVFVHEGGPAGPRFRLEKTDGQPGWTLAGRGTRVSDEELALCLDETPLRLSTSALLRPLVQDTLFPTAAYVGGPAELGYFAQLGPLYDHFGLSQPLVVLRARFRCVDEKAQRLLGKLGLCAADFEGGESALERKLANAPGSDALLPPDLLASEVDAALGPLLTRLERTVVGVDPTLARPAERTRAQVRASLERLLAKYSRALARQDETRWHRIEHLRTLLAPEGKPQERHYGWASFAARAGEERFRDAVLAALASPFTTDIKELCP